jgi:hypothetical protein
MNVIKHAWVASRGWLVSLLSAPVLIVLVINTFQASLNLKWSDPYIIAMIVWSLGSVLTGLLRYHYFLEGQEEKMIIAGNIFSYISIAIAVSVFVF